MSPDPLAIYLNDHLAGSVAGIDMIETLMEQTQGTPLSVRLRTLAEEVREDQQLVRDTLDRLDAGERRLAQAAAWVTKKVSEGRLAVMGHNHPMLALFEGLEAIALGLQGKLAMFRILAELEPHDPQLTGFPFAARAIRTAAQHAMVEADRLAAGREAFGAAPAARG